MLRSIEVENCYSFYEKTEFSLLVNNKAPNSDKYLKSINTDERLCASLSVFGANSAGKSNLLRSISFIKWLIIDSFGENPDDGFDLKPFMLKEAPFEPSKIKVEFETASKVFRYCVEIQKDVLLNESLEALELDSVPENGRKRFKQLFVRKLNSSNEYDIKANSDFGLADGIKDLIKKRTNASLVSAALLTSHEQSLEIKAFWDKVVTRFKQFGDRIYPFEYHVFKSSEFYYKNKDFKDSMEAIMSKSDLGLVGLDIDKLEVPDSSSKAGTRQIYMPHGKHSGMDGKAYRLPFPLESSGTQQIYVLLSLLLPSLRSGGLAIIDELEADLHPDILPKLIDLFTDKKTNPKGAQLLFTCHATPLLKTLDKYQVVFVEKGVNGCSSSYRLDDRGVRSDENYFAKYLSGSYGGIPKVTGLG